MHYSRLIKVPADQPATLDMIKPSDSENVTKKIDTKLDHIIDIMRNNISPSAPEGYDDTVLNDGEIGEVMGTLMDFHKTHFPDIPMAEELDPRFVWNIPLEIYKAHIHAKEYGLDDIFDPLILLYLFITPYPAEAYGKFLLTLYNMIRNNDNVYKELKDLSTEYDLLIHDDNEDTEDEEG